MRPILIGGFGIAIASILGATPADAIKKTSYPEVKVKPADAVAPDAAFTAMRKAFTDAVTKKDGAALFALVGPSFVWTNEGSLSEGFDPGREALHNFKVAFGFREAGKDADGGVQDGPFWDVLADFARESAFFASSTNLVCTPMAAEVMDEKAYQAATKKLSAPDDTPEWYFTLADTTVAKAPGDSGPPVGKVGKVALPVLAAHPPEAKDGPTHLEVLLPTGKTGWIPVAAASPLIANRLCFSKTASGDWKISNVDQNRN
jgi:hypothetical protein